MRFQRRSEQGTGIDPGPVPVDLGRSRGMRSLTRLAVAAGLALSATPVEARAAIRPQR